MLAKNLKTDASFIEKLAMGAIGTRRVFLDLEAQGHKPLELERGSMSFKLWKAIKIKRVRLPDLLCLGCSQRVESRAKSTLEVSMSHSRAIPERGWDHGLCDGDSVAFVLCDRNGARPIDWHASDLVQYVSVAALRASFRSGRVVLAQPKGAQEGFELRVAWPTAVASAAGHVEAIREGQSIRYRRPDGRALSVRLVRGDQWLQPLVSAGDSVRAGQVLAGVVPVSATHPCHGRSDVNTYLELCAGVGLSDRYAAVKALGHFDDVRATAALLARVQDEHEHIYVRLDAAAGLLRRGHPSGIKFLKHATFDSYLANRLESVIVLGEVAQPEAARLLIETLLDAQQHPEIRAGAAWSLGEAHALEALPHLVQSFSDLALTVRVEAARALAKAARTHADLVTDLFATASAEQRPGVAWAMAKAGGITLDRLLPALADDDAREWVAYIVGTQPKEAFLPGIELLAQRDAEVYFAATVLWKILSSWTHGLEEY
jgi:HEAT repeat protein